MTGAWVASYLALWILVIALASTTLVIARSLRRARAAGPVAAAMAAPAPRPQGPAPGAALWDALADPGELAWAGGPVLMLFVSRGCGHCVTATANIGALRAIPSVTVAVRTRDPIELSSDPHAGALRLHDVSYAHDAAAFPALRIDAVPYVVLADAAGAVLASRAGADPDEVRAMVARALAASPPA
jgi:hypothetical protein